MKSFAVWCFFLWLQGPLVVQLDAPVRPEFFQYSRAVAVPGSGVACAPLDVTVLAHTASPAHADLRLFNAGLGGPETEVPYTLTESGPEPLADTLVAPEHVVVKGNELRFDLPMPARPYSEVRLRLGLKNFVATVTAEGRDLKGGRQALGSVGLFDLSGQGLGQWRSLLLGESTWPVLHLTADVRTASGAPLLDLSPAMVQGAEVPPSRLRQTRYVPTVRTRAMEQHGELTEALLRVPAHVPVERVLFGFAPGFATSFSRDVTVSARADKAPVTDTEALDAGDIAHLDLPSGDPRLLPITLREDALDATLGATLVRPATVLVAVNNNGRPPLPIREVVLEMRERKLCFFADREGKYVLRYGDPGLSAPLYDESAWTVPATPLAAVLGPEAVNPQFRTRRDSRPFLQRHPELFWVLVLVCGGTMGGTALHHVQHRRV